jgi:RsiW-degrading membrane proteinase PrsW (M82 family)
MSLHLILLTIAPAIAICIYIYWQDKFEKEPRKLLIASFFLGVFSTVPTIIISMIGQYLGFHPESHIMWWSLISCIVGIGLVEEYCKFFFVRFHSYRKEAFNEPFDGITYSVMVAMGFATLENFLYVSDGGEQTAWIRMFTAVPGHATDGVFIGFFLGLQKIMNKSYYGLIGLGLTAVAHGLYDFFAINAKLDLSFLLYWLIVFVLAIYLSFKAIRMHQRSSPFSRNMN